MEDCSKGIFQYYTIINDAEDSTNDAEGDNNQVVYLTIEQDNETTSATESSESESNTGESNTLSFNPNVRILTFDDAGRMFMTTPSEDESFEAVEPHLITTDNTEDDVSVESKTTENSNDDNYEIVQVVGGPSQMYQMIYCDVPTPDEQNVKKGKSYICLYEGCGKMYSAANDLNVHMRSHLDNKPYVCTEEGCDKAFSTNYSLKAHIRTHTGEKPYGCVETYRNIIEYIQDCGKRFTEYSSLYKHNLVHQIDRPYKCVFCGQKFKQESAMKLHKRVKHNIVLASDGTELVLKL
ncbi:hypothetical protein NQ318_001646 [Aromia moschata]|uniref:C2H2-type domain-containing protein n=1 Tax=Aromia moschata TaxID=1265417 RepID=A0AAV8XZY7_9CUCU|nr:hypothetical protein NQ318_001646 [Aromia moschata]